MWEPLSDKFTGSNIEFVVQNTSSVVLGLANLRNAPKLETQVDDHYNRVVLTPARAKTVACGPVDVLVTVNDTARIQRLDGIYASSALIQGLDRVAAHKIRVKLLHSTPQDTIHLDRVLLEEGGSLLHGPQSSTWNDLSSPSQNQLSTNFSQRIKQSRRKIIEVVASTPFSDAWLPNRKDTVQYSESWSNLLEGRFTNTAVSVLPLPNDTCLTHLCQTSTTMAPQVKDVYFRAGSPGTELHKRLWSPSWTESIPSALVMMLGSADVDMFLRKTNGTKHQTFQFIEGFAHSYANLIRMIRRTAYSSSTLNVAQGFNQEVLEDEVDESYLYNSASSSVPIFLVLPPFPASEKSRYVRTIFSQTLRKVLNELKWHIGDEKTFVVDTADWFEEQNFILNDPEPGFGLSQSGHVKFAYHLSLHLCHYLVNRDPSKLSSKCPFDRHDEYFGNLYVPETAGLGKMIEERKVAKMKEVFRVIDHRNRGSLV